MLIIGIFDLLTAGKVALSDPAWQGFSTEVYIVLGADLFRVLLRHVQIQPRPGTRVQPRPQSLTEDHHRMSQAVATPRPHGSNEPAIVLDKVNKWYGAHARAARRLADGGGRGSAWWCAARRARASRP